MRWGDVRTSPWSLLLERMRRQLTMAALPVLPLWLHSPAPAWASAMIRGEGGGLLGPRFHPWMENGLSLVNSYIFPMWLYGAALICQALRVVLRIRSGE